MAIIFDLDGTLLDSIDDLGNTMNTVLKRHGFPVHDRATYQTYVGNGMKKLVERALPHDCEDFDAILDEYLQEYEMHLTDASVPYEGVIDTLNYLNQQHIPIAICTNKKQAYTDKIVAHYFPTIDFVAVVGDQFDGNHKPNPTYPLEIAKIMGKEPETIVFVGDSDVDMKTAHNAGMIPIGVSWGFRSVEELKEHGAVKILTSFKDVRSLI